MTFWDHILELKAARADLAWYARMHQRNSATQTYLDSVETTVSTESAPPFSPVQNSDLIRRTTILQHPSAADNMKRALTFDKCGSRYMIFQSDDGLVVHPTTCKDRLCPSCARTRASQLYAQTHRTLKLMSAPKHIVLTLRSTDQPLRRQVDFMTRCWRLLRQEPFWPKTGAWGYAVIEITKNLRTGRYHPHYHILLCSPFLDWTALKTSWLRLTGTSHDVQISRVLYDRASWLASYLQKATALYDYDDDPWAPALALKGKRMLQPFGKFPRLPDPHVSRLILICSVSSALRQAACGSLYHTNLIKWVAANAPYALDELRPPIQPDPNAL